MATYYWVGGSGTWNGTGNTQFAITSGGVATALNPTNVDTVIFDSNSGTAAVVTVASTAVSLETTINKSDINLSLNGNVTLCISTGALTLTAGTITLNTYTLTAGNLQSSNTNARTIAFGTGNITLTGNNGTIIGVAVATALTLSGVPTINLTYAGATGTRTLRWGSSTGYSSAIAFTLNINAGTDIVNAALPANNLIFTGFLGSFTVAGISLFGNAIFSSGMTVSASASAFTFAATSGTQQITTNGKTLDFPVTQNGIGGTVQLQDNLTIGITRTFTLTNGTLDLSNGNRTLSTGLFASTNTNTRVIAFGTGNITTTGSGTVWNTSSTTGFSYTGTPTVNITNNSATATTVSTGAMIEAQSLNFSYTTGSYTLTDTAAVYKSVNFTGFTGTIPNSVRTIYGSMTLAAGMILTAGTNATTFASTAAGNTITSAGKTLDFPVTFNGINGVWACQDALTLGSTRVLTLTNGTLNLKAGATSTVGSFVTTGTNQKYLSSSTPGTAATISQTSGTVNSSYLTIKDINATGGATWNALWSNNNVDAGDNSGWIFGDPPIINAVEYTYALRSLTEPRRF